MRGKKKRIYTRHHATFHHEYHPHAVKYDLYCNKISTHIVAITSNVFDILTQIEGVKPDKITIVHHGFDFNAFKRNDSTELSKKYNSAGRYPVIGVISRFTEWKGVQYIIPAFEKLLQEFPDALLILANANGDYKNEIAKKLERLPQRNYLTIGFEPDIIGLYKLFNVFVHVPVDRHSEAFGQVYIEALAAQLPCVFTLSGIAHDFIKNDENALVVDYKNENEIYKAIIKLLHNKKFADQLAAKGKEDVIQMFGIERMINTLEEVYEK